jgi:hypothetical protein
MGESWTDVNVEKIMLTRLQATIEEFVETEHNKYQR